METCAALAGSLGALVLLLAPAAAQTPLLIVNSFSTAVPADMDAVGDWDGDGIGDVATGIPNPFQGSPGYVRILSGADGSLLAKFTGTFSQQRFGMLVAGVGDADADGVVDVAVGAVPESSSLLPASVHVFSGATGADLFTQDFGFSELSDLDDVGDADGDGFADLVTGGFGCPGGGLGTSNPGMATLYSLATRSVLHQWCGDGPGDHFGTYLAGAGDVNADGHPDIVVGAREADDYSPEGTGYVRVFSGLTGETLHTFQGPPTDNNGFGEAVDGAGDVNGDGHADLLVGARQEKVDGAFIGAATVYSGADGSVLHHVLGSIPNEQFGVRVAGPGDVDGDGLADFAVATWQVQGSPGALPGYEMYSGADAGLLHVVSLPTSYIGQSLRDAGDLQGDGIPDLLIVSLLEDPVLGDYGSLQVRSGAPVLFANLGFALPGTSGPPQLQIEGVLAAGLPLALDVSAAPALSPVFLVIGAAATPVPFKGGVLVPAPQLIAGGLATDASGDFALQATLTSALPAGMQLVVQCWLPDAGAPAGFAATNAVFGVAP